jgi:hypothetical protein
LLLCGHLDFYLHCASSLAVVESCTIFRYINAMFVPFQHISLSCEIVWGYFVDKDSTVNRLKAQAYHLHGTHLSCV